MLLRSASSPLLKSSCSFREPDLGTGIQIHPSTPRSISINKIPRTLSDGDLNHLHVSNTKTLSTNPLLTSSRDHHLLLEEDSQEGEEEGEFSTYIETTCRFPGGLLLEDGRGGGGGGNGGFLGGGGGGDGDAGKGSDQSMDVYYQKMIRAYPEDALILANYARFLKEVQGDFVKAEEYCGRAILTKPGDGNVLALFGDLIWINHKDAARAKTYFDQAVHSAPHDCHVLASYAKFLWDAGEDDDENDDDLQQACTSQPSFLPPLTAAY